jgi:ATP-binding cassette, subfamily B, multidrug efflux pump
MDSGFQYLLKHPILFYIKSHRRAFAIGVVFLFVTNFLDASTPLVLKYGIDALTSSAPQQNVEKFSLLLLLVMGTLAWTRFGWRMYWGRFHTHAAEDLRNKVFFHLTKMGPKFFNKNPIGELMSLITNDVNSFRQGIGPGLLIFLDGVFIIAIVLPMMISLQPDWTWKTLAFLPLVPFLIWKAMGMIHRAYKTSQDRLSEMTGVSQEIVGGIRVIKAFGQEFNKTQNFNKYSQAYLDAADRLALVDTFYFFITQAAIISGTLILFWIGAPEVVSGAVTIGTFVAFQNYINRMVWPMSALGLGLSNIQKGLASFDRIRELFVQNSDVEDSGQLELESVNTLELKNVSFSYSQEAQTLRDISIKISKGETIGITGPVGAGKTTLLSLLTRLYNVDSGTILINGKDISEYSLQSLRKHIALVPQEAFLFSDTISENISFGLDRLEKTEKISETLETVDIDNEIKSLPQSYKSQLGERGVNLSGGQKQRLTIARGIILNSSVVILDDSLSAVDTKTEKKIQESLLQSSRDSTKIIVTHRVSTLEGVDRIIVLKDGQVEAVGPISELLHSSSTFKTMASIQGISSKHQNEGQVL